MVKSSEVSAPWPLHGAGSDGSVPRQEQAEPRDGQRPCGVPGEHSITHLRAESALKPGSWVPTCISSHTLTLENSQLGGEKVINLVFGVCLFLLAKGEREEQLLHAPLTPEVWLHLRAVTWRKKLRVPVGKSL